MPKAKARDGVYTRPDRPGFWASWIDASGRRRRRKLNAATLQQARALLNAEKVRIDELKTKGYAAPTADSFGSVLDRYLKYQKPRLTPGSYARTKGIAEGHLRPALDAFWDQHQWPCERSPAKKSGSSARQIGRHVP